MKFLSAEELFVHRCMNVENLLVSERLDNLVKYAVGRGADKLGWSVYQFKFGERGTCQFLDERLYR